MSDTQSTESQEPKLKTKVVDKLTAILAGGALLLSLVNTVLIVMNPAAKKVEQFNEELKTDLADSVASLHKKIDGLHTADVEWQSVLKKAKEHPDATYKVVNTKDGYLTLTEIEPAEASPAK